MDDPYSYVAEFKRISVSLNYERIFQRIYGSQIKLLQFLAALENSVKEFVLAQSYAEHISLAENSNLTLVEYINFLKDSGLLIETGKDHYRINQYGKDFLTYIVEQYPYTWNGKSM